MDNKLFSPRKPIDRLNTKSQNKFLSERKSPRPTERFSNSKPQLLKTFSDVNCSLNTTSSIITKATK